MKTIYTILFLTSFLALKSSVQATTITAKTNNGDWTSNSTWNLNRTPQAADTVVIPASFTVNVYTNATVSGDVVIQLGGMLKFNHSSKLNLGSASKINLSVGSMISSINSSASDQLRIGGNTVYKGNSGNLQGPGMLDSSGFHAIAAISLPVKFVSFTLARLQSNILVQWSTAMETNSSLFIIEKSENGTNWTSIGTVKAAGESNSLINYSYTDKNAASAVLYYRIKQVDLDGTFVYTPVKAIKSENGNAAISISAASPNTVLVNFSQQVKSTVMMRLVSASGQVIAQQNIANPSGQVVFSTANTSNGIYIINITDGKDLKMSKQILL